MTASAIVIFRNLVCSFSGTRDRRFGTILSSRPSTRYRSWQREPSYRLRRAGGTTHAFPVAPNERAGSPSAAGAGGHHDTAPMTSPASRGARLGASVRGGHPSKELPKKRRGSFPERSGRHGQFAPRCRSLPAGLQVFTRYEIVYTAGWSWSRVEVELIERPTRVGLAWVYRWALVSGWYRDRREFVSTYRDRDRDRDRDGKDTETRQKRKRN